MSQSIHSIRTEPSSRREWALRIKKAHAKSVEAIIRVGSELIAAKAALPHGEFQKMIRRDLPFKERTAQKFMKIARHPFLSNASAWTHLPPEWTLLYRLSSFEPDILEELFNDEALKKGGAFEDAALPSYLLVVDTIRKRRMSEAEPQQKPAPKIEPALRAVSVESPKEETTFTREAENPPSAEAISEAPYIEEVMQEDADGVEFVERSGTAEPEIADAEFREIEPPGLLELREAWESACPMARRKFVREVSELY